MKTVLFHRDFREFTGGHLKVWDYFNHADVADGWRAAVHFSPGSVWENNPWAARRAEVLPTWEPERADALFLGGFDWNMLPTAERAHYRRPIVNLIQHVRHADPADPLSAFLPHRALRICVSAEVQDAIWATGRVNGPTVAIPNGIDLDALPLAPRPSERPIDWLICGLKDGRSAVAKQLARQMQAAGTWGRVEALTKPLPRAEFLAKMANASRVVLLPRSTEGFYLPALEAMALGCLVVCPDCVGNRSFCRDEVTALVPASGTAEDVVSTLAFAAGLSTQQEDVIRSAARAVAARHTLARERAAFHQILASLPSRW